MSDMKLGWFVGDFDPVIFKNKSLEVGYKKILKGYYPKDKHYHLLSMELNYIISKL